MQPFTVTQWAILALVFVAGWLLGLASHAGGRKWRERYAAERDAHATYRRDDEARVAAARADADTRVAAAETRAREIERDHARLAAAAPVTAATVAPTRTVVTRPVYAPGERRGWFDWGNRRS
ncbi:hypothetical protein [Sphingomonas sp.]|uniref:hypothetical protein n=1 Tax=Sphingomonas sp. TaxID=28214 RepID=UPI003B0094DA